MKSAVWADALSCFSTDGPIYLAGCCGEPTAFLDSLEDDPDLARGRRFTGVWIPGVNKRDPTSCGERTATTIFASPSLQNSIRAGRVNLLPMHYSTTFNWLSKNANLSGGIFQVPPPGVEVSVLVYHLILHQVSSLQMFRLSGKLIPPCQILLTAHAFQLSGFSN